MKDLNPAQGFVEFVEDDHTYDVDGRGACFSAQISFVKYTGAGSLVTEWKALVKSRVKEYKVIFYIICPSRQCGEPNKAALFQ